MSYYGGGGGGWAPPVPPPQAQAFFNQPPPGLHPQFYTDIQGYPHNVQPEFQQPGYNPYIPAPVPVPQGLPPVSVPPPTSVTVQEAQVERDLVQLEREQRRPGYESPQRRYSPSPRGDERRDRRHSPDLRRQSPDLRRPSPDRGHSYRDDDDDRYRRRMRSPSDGHVHRRQKSEDRGRPRQREMERTRESPEPPSKPKVDIDALLQDERLRNVLFAGISKATAKLEQSLQEGKSGEHPDFESKETKSQLFPSASSSQKPRSILKRKDGGESDESKTLSSLSALERTLHMLRGKGDLATAATSSRSSSERNAPNKGALSQLSAYDEGHDEENSHFEKSEKPQTEKQKTTPAHPFWSVPSRLETAKRESDSFDAKEKMFEEWRQSIGKHSDSKPSQREMLRDVESVMEINQKYRDKQRTTGEGENQEELDSTVQNILQSIGFNFDLSRRMQELARKKKRQEDEGNMVNTSASFMNKGDILAEELKATLLQSGSDISSIETLLKEARAQGSRRSSRMRSPSPDVRDDSRSRGVRETSQSSRQEFYGREEEQHRSRDLTQTRYETNNQWERVSPNKYSSPQRFSPPRRTFRERDSLSPPGGYEDRNRRESHNLSERFRDDNERNEYFYPEKEFVDTPSVPLLTSFSSRKKDEDLSGGLLKSMRVENFRVMSRPNNTDQEESFVETRRVILPAKSEHKNLSPSNRGVKSPSRIISRKRSASPLSLRVTKEKRMALNIRTDDYKDYSRRRSPDDLHSVRKSLDDYSAQPTSSHRSNSRDQSPLHAIVERKKSPIRQRSPSPSRRRSRERVRERSRSPYKRRSRSRNRSPYRHKSPLRRRRSPSPRHKSPSPRRKSPSPRRKSPSPRGRSRSPKRRKRSPPPKSAPSQGRRKSPIRGSDRSRGGERNKQGSSKADKGKNNTDLSKLPDSERKAHLQKMLVGKGGSVAGKKGSVAGKDASESTGTSKENGNWEKVVDAFEKLSDMTVLQRSELTSKVRMLNSDEQTKTLNNLAARKSKVLALKQDLERMKKAQNELMRKSQRSGLGNKDPHLKANNLSQLEIEKEMDRLSAPDLDVEVKSNLEQRLATFQAKAAKEASFDSTPKAKTSAVSKSDVKSTKEATPHDTKAKALNNQPAVESSGQTSWVSVTVKEEALPEIKDSKEKIPKSEDKKVAKRERKSPPAPLLKSKKNIYYEYVDGGNHWCRTCHIACNALDQYFNHCHGKKHMHTIENVSRPWRSSKKNDDMNKRKVGQAQTRRVKGSEMLFPVAGFYCTLCSTFCGDFFEAEAHLKSDSHYGKYLDHLRDNPSYEKKLLLEKSKDRKLNEPRKTEVKQTPPPPPTPKEIKKGKKAKTFRQKIVDEEKEAVNCDNTETVDMEIDDDDERDDDVDVEGKVPKMTGKCSSLVTILSGLPESSESSSSVEMKSSLKDEVKSLGNFLTIAKVADESEPKQPSKLPVITVKPEENLSSIPIPESMDLSSIPVPKAVELVAIPLPNTGQPNKDDNVVATVKTLQEIQDEEKRVIDEDKRMMGIDVDAEEEKPLAPIRRPPPLSKTMNEASKGDVQKPKSLDSLFSKVSLHKKIKTTRPASSTSTESEKSEMELRIQKEINEKLEREKEKMKRQQERKERREKMLEERKMLKKKVFSDSSSEEETESEEEEDQVAEVSETGNEKIEPNLINLSESEKDSVANTSDDAKEIVQVQNDNESTEAIQANFNVDGNSTPMEEVQEQNNNESTEAIQANLNVDGNTTPMEQVQEQNNNESTEANQANLNIDGNTTPIEEVQEQNNNESTEAIQANLNIDGNPTPMEEVQEKNDNESTEAIQANWNVDGNSRQMDEVLLKESVDGNVVHIEENTPGQIIDDIVPMEVNVTQKMFSPDQIVVESSSNEKSVGADLEVHPRQNVVDQPTDENLISEQELAASKGGKKLFVQTEQEKSQTAMNLSIEQITDTHVTSEKEITPLHEQIAVESSGTSGEHSEVLLDQKTPKVSTPQSSKKKGKKPPAAKKAIIKALQSESDLLGVLTTSPQVIATRGIKKAPGAKRGGITKRGGKARTPSKAASEIAPDETELEFFMDDFVVLSEVTEEDEGNVENAGGKIMKGNEDKDNVEVGTSQSTNLREGADEAAEEKNEEAGNLDQPTCEVEKVEVEMSKPAAGGKGRATRSGGRGRGRGGKKVSQRGESADINVTSGQDLCVDSGEKVGTVQAKTYIDLSEAKEGDDVQNTSLEEMNEESGEKKTVDLAITWDSVEEAKELENAEVDMIQPSADPQSKSVQEKEVENIEVDIDMVQPVADAQSKSVEDKEVENVEVDDTVQPFADAQSKSIEDKEVENVEVDDTVQPSEDAQSKSVGDKETENVEVDDQNKSVRSGGRSKSRRVTAKQETTPCVSEPQSEQSAIDEGEKSQTLLKDIDQSSDSACTLDGSLSTFVEEEVATPVVGRTRRSGRTAAAKNTPVQKPSGRQTRSRGKKNVPEVEQHESESKDETDEIVKGRTLRSREPKVTNVAVDEAMEEFVKDDYEEIRAKTSENTEAQGAIGEKDVISEGTSVQEEAGQEDADSDATITEEGDSNCDQAFQDEVAIVQPMSIGTSQAKDPPMSGVVTESECAENVVMPMDEEGMQMTTDVSEFESLPTAGLSFGLEDDSDSIDFTMVEEEGKSESQDS